MSLARKISVLFGTAVLLTIAVTLAFPWLQMSSLNEQSMLLQAKRVASIAYQAANLSAPDWTAASRELERRWPVLTDQFGLTGPPPELIPVRFESELTADDAMPGAARDDWDRQFRQDAVARLRRNPQQRYYWRIEPRERLFRCVLAVRATELDPYPDELRGLIDVRLPIARDRSVWNSVVTILAGASGAVLAILVFYMISERLVLSPVQSLRRVAEQVATGDIKVESSIASGDEFQSLSEAFNHMLSHLRAAQEEQRKINRSLDIRLGELAETNVALYESNRLKSEFLANVSHELRTPLVSIIGFAELLRDAWGAPNVDPKRLARFSENILTSGRSLLELINDLLDLAKIEAGKLELHLSEFSLAELCGDLVDFVRPLADKREQQLELSVAEDLPQLYSDSGKIKQILYNLLSNAVKFTPARGSIRLIVEVPTAGAVRMIVSDTGPGIPETSRKVIFEKFRQMDSSETREHEGTGLGLAITKDLVQLLAGSIRLESEPETGATFIVELPVTVPSRAERSRTGAV